MKQRVSLAVLGLIAALSLAWAAVRTRSLASSPSAPALASPLPAPAAYPGAAPLDPARLRDIFSFQDEAPLELEPVRERTTDPGRSALATGPRLVGLVRRSGRLFAVLALDGEVEIAAAGGSAVGVTVLSVDEDSVRIRRSDGSEATLPY